MYYNSDWQVDIRESKVAMKYDLFFYYRSGDTVGVMNNDSTITTYPKGALISDKPTIELDSWAFRSLVDAIYAKHKPSEGKFTEGKLEATENHLKDLRQLLKLK